MHSVASSSRFALAHRGQQPRTLGSGAFVRAGGGDLGSQSTHALRKVHLADFRSLHCGGSANFGSSGAVVKYRIGLPGFDVGYVAWRRLRHAHSLLRNPAEPRPGHRVADYVRRCNAIFADPDHRVVVRGMGDLGELCEAVLRELGSTIDQCNGLRC